MLVRLFALLSSLLVSVALADVTSPPALRSIAQPRLPDIPALIDRLADTDPTVRTEAANRLSALAQFARPQLMRAMDSASPEVRSQISKILLHRDWATATDTPPVRALLSNYAELDVEGRRQQIIKLSQLPANDTSDVLLRIVQNDPSAAARWTAAEVIHNANTDRAFQDELRSISLATAAKDSDAALALANNAPLLSICGWAWREIDLDRTGVLLNEAIDVDAIHPAALNGQLEFAYLWLIQTATDNERYMDALRLLRQQAARTTWDESNLPAPVANLIAFHAEHGPFPGFQCDLQTYRAYLVQPQLIYALARMCDRQNHPAFEIILDALALIDGGISSEQHCQTGGFLIDQGWANAARVELRLSLWLSHGNEVVNSYFQLARLAGQTGDEFATASNLESALTRLSGLEMRRTTRFGEVLPWSDSDAWAEVHWHYLKAARASNDMASVETHLQKLLELDRLGQILQKDPGLATDIVPALNDTGRTNDAKRCFDAAYKNLHDAIAADANDPEAKNNLAWLCARCDQRLDEAVKLADEAVKTAPGNSAYLDTDAEAHFRVGDRTQAAALEIRALQLKPGDKFMKEQLKRFETEPTGARAP